MKKLLNYIRLLALGIFVIILLEQQFNFYSQIAPLNKSIVKGGDFISQKEQSFASLKNTLPKNGTYRYESDNIKNSYDYLMYYYIAEYSLAPRIITDSLYMDTVIGVFPKTLSINNPQNPLYANRTQWTVIEDNGAGIMLLKKNK